MFSLVITMDIIDEFRGSPSEARVETETSNYYLKKYGTDFPFEINFYYCVMIILINPLILTLLKWVHS